MFGVIKFIRVVLGDAGNTIEVYTRVIKDCISIAMVMSGFGQPQPKMRTALQS